MVEGACLENRCGETHRGFESLSLRLSIFRLNRGGARVVEWGRLLSGCWGKTQPGVRIPPPRLIPFLYIFSEIGWIFHCSLKVPENLVAVCPRFLFMI